MTIKTTMECRNKLCFLSSKFMDPYKDDVISFGPIRAETVWPPPGMVGMIMN